MSGSRGPLSDPNALRRNLKPSAIQLPINGYDGPVPEWPLHEASEAELERWDRLWHTAQAAMWVRQHIDLSVALYVRVSLAVEAEAKNNVATAQTLNSMTAMQDRLGLNSQALNRLNWEVASDEIAERRADAKGPRRVAAVDPAAG